MRVTLTTRFRDGITSGRGRRSQVAGNAAAAPATAAAETVRPTGDNQIAVRRYDNFSDHDFELFIADLLGADRGLRYETFPRGRDQGVDLRAIPPRRKRPHVVQCKHFVGSSFSTLRAAARKEAARLSAAGVRFASYTFVTSQPLTALRKSRLAEDLLPWIASDSDVLGANDLETLLDRHPEVERRQVKLWLTGGTQLAALLRAGTVHRSQSLLEDIQRSLPSYVQGGAFDEARQRLRDQRVLVIAGVPGIGKTTLARILMADAVLDGYEPIEVSHDVEEGWEMLDDSIKQIFLYDDFLGRTALAERFAKNEDRRLVDFMDRTARRSSTLFLLTTREYILRQAGALYERIAQSGVEDRRYLLELPSYTRVDRARIFANHAFHSPTLTDAAKRALLVDDAYERIIDHTNYNPRVIEWITGMGGRKLGPREVDDYVTFAVDILDHPELIWKHAFTNEIDDYGRVLVLVLASLARPTEIERVEAAFDALCRQRDLTLTGQAFRRTLAALDDSLVATRHGSGNWYEAAGILVAPHDPSIVDFVTDYVRGSAADIEQIADAALFFEQASWLWDVATRDGIVPNRLAATMSGALQRTYDAPSLSPVVVPLSTYAWTHRPPGTVDHEARLARVLQLADGAGPERETLLHWCRARFAERAAAWERGEGQPPSILTLLKLIRGDHSFDADAAARSATGAMSASWAIVQDTEWRAELRSLFPDAYTLDEWAAVVDEFASWLEDDLAGSANDMIDTEELRQVERVADRLGVVIDEDELEAVEDHIRENVAEREQQASSEEDDWEPQASAPADARREVEAIFARLADGPNRPMP
jgi:hypothetical protein